MPFHPRKISYLVVLRCRSGTEEIIGAILGWAQGAAGVFRGVSSNVRWAPILSPRLSKRYKETPLAQVVKLVDALASGASPRKGVKVRVLSWAPDLLSMQA
jgi:hypothetical protein